MRQSRREGIRGGKESETRLELVRERCRASGLKLTIQRQAVLEAFVGLPDHPTADSIHASVSASMPGISRTTTYRTLDRLVSAGVIDRACHPGSAARFDGRTGMHHHLVCMDCEEIVDISDARLDRLPVPDTSALGFKVHDFRVELRGLCRRCRARTRKEESE